MIDTYRKLFKKKYKLSKQLRTITSIQRCSTIRKNILNLDIEIKPIMMIEDDKKNQFFLKSQKRTKIICTDF